MAGYYEAGSSATTVWTGWVLDSNSITSTADCSYIWRQWASGTADNTTSGATSNNIWYIWAGQAGQYVPVGQVQGQLQEPTPEEIEAVRKSREEWNRKQEEERKARERADKRARKLFLDVVGKRKYKEFRKKKYHDVVAASGKRYRLALHATIQEMDGMFGDKAKARLCVHPDNVPAYDTLVAQLLFLLSGKEGEEQLVKTANRTVVAA